MSKRKIFRKTAWLLSVCFVSLIFVSAVFVDDASAKRVFVRFGGSNPGGSWYTIAGGITSLFNKEIKDMNASSVATGGSVDCNRQARKHNLDTWLSHSLHAYDNWNGVGIFKDEGKFQDFRMMAGVYESWHHFVALEKSGIKTMSDLAGKKIAVGSAGSGAGSYLDARLVLTRFLIRGAALCGVQLADRASVDLHNGYLSRRPHLKPPIGGLGNVARSGQATEEDVDWFLLGSTGRGRW